jgi:hypothetical protein
VALAQRRHQSGRLRDRRGAVAVAVCLLVRHVLSLATSSWFAAGGVIASVSRHFTKRRNAGSEHDALPSDMSTVSLVGGGLIAGDALAALGLGVAGLLATLLA